MESMINPRARALKSTSDGSAPASLRPSRGSIAVLDSTATPKIVTIRAGTLGRVAKARVLLDDHPSVKIGRLERADDCRDIDQAISEWTEDGPSEGVSKAPAFPPGTSKDIWIDVFQVQVTDQVAVIAHKLCWVATAVRVMAGIEAERGAGFG